MALGLPGDSLCWPGRAHAAGNTKEARTSLSIKWVYLTWSWDDMGQYGAGVKRWGSEPPLAALLGTWGGGASLGLAWKGVAAADEGLGLS